jgi:PleD family two-component response regulator
MADNAPMPLHREQRVPTMLVVARDPKMLKLLQMALITEFECEVLSITGGKSATDKAQLVLPDLMIIDAHLLDGNAFDLSDQLHAIPELERVPIILLNMLNVSKSVSQREHVVVLDGPFVLIDVYAAVHRCLGHT